MENFAVSSSVVAQRPSERVSQIFLPCENSSSGPREIYATDRSDRVAATTIGVPYVYPPVKNFIPVKKNPILSNLRLRRRFTRGVHKRDTLVGNLMLLHCVRNLRAIR